MVHKKKLAERKGFGKFQLCSWKGIFVLVLLAGGILLSAGCLGQEALQRVGISDQGSSLAVPYQLSAEQSALVSEKEYPEAFILLFYEEEAAFGSLQTVRQETWAYYSSGESYLFINGELDSMESLDIEQPGSLAPLPYTPEQFSAHMDRDEVLVAAGVDDFIEVPLEKEYLESGDLYYAESLAFGLVDGELRYLEALALIEE